MSLPSTVHVFSVIKCEASGDWEARYSVVFQIGSFAKYVYVYMCVMFVFFCILFCAENSKEYSRESSSRKVQDGRNQSLIFAFLLSPIKGK